VADLRTCFLYLGHKSHGGVTRSAACSTIFKQACGEASRSREAGNRGHCNRGPSRSAKSGGSSVVRRWKQGVCLFKRVRSLVSPFIEYSTGGLPAPNAGHKSSEIEDFHYQSPSSESARALLRTKLTLADSFVHHAVSLPLI
jgi:hypothetical protein